ncbi:MAG TPA: helix-turn-helix domain-containing protein [Solirubrobacterales bacterium]|nr:helix-turn-helix domain-containing protein [Solirubrobacterales bacterium]
MGIPSAAFATPGSDGWSQLDADAKRDRLLAASREVFAREGIDAPMPAIAVAAGVGVGSIYRQFPSKLDLLSALVIERLEEVEAAATAALGAPDDAWSSLVELIWEFGTRQSEDDVVAEAMSCVLVEPHLEAARAQTNKALAQLLAAARAEGRLREDATVLDIRMIFAAARAAEKIEPGGWRRMIELGIDSLRPVR